MFEKEAEEYADEYGKDAFTQFNMPQWIKPIRMERKLGFQKGAEFGFQKGIKAKINTTTISDCPIKKQWHKVTDGDLPTKEKEYLLKFKDGTIDVIYVGVDGNLAPFILTTEGIDFFNDIEKWCEIPKED